MMRIALEYVRPSDRRRQKPESRAITTPIEVIALMGITVGVISAFALAGIPLWAAALIGANTAALAIAFFRGGRSLVTPTIILSGIFTGFGILGYFVYPIIQAYGRTPGHDPKYLIVTDESLRLSALAWFLAASLAVVFGSMLVRGVSYASANTRGIGRALSGIAESNLPLWFASASILLNLLVRDFDELLNRDSYHIDTEIGGVATYLQLPAAFMLGMVYLRRNVFSKLLVLTLITVIVGFSFALSSRMLSLAVLMFFAGVAVSSRRLRWVPILIGVVAALLLMPIPIYMRGLPEQGLIPNWNALGLVPIFSEQSYWSTAGNLLSSFSVVALTGGYATIPWESLALSILPLPGSVFGGAAAGAELRINFAIPYAGLGEVANQGPIFFTIFFLTLGLIAGWVERMTERLREVSGPTAETLVPVAVAALTAFLYVQYNLRTAMRLEYVLVACGVYVWVRATVLRKRQDVHASG